MGRPYRVGTLGGGTGAEERLVSRLDAFDCVTFVDVVIALAFSQAPTEFHPRLRTLRYRRGQVDWLARNHYTHAWLDRNVTAGLLEPLLPQLWIEVGAARSLDILEGHPAVPWQPRYLPWTERAALLSEVRTGDWVGFISNRPRLDTFHVGMLVHDGSLTVRHASQSRGQVIRESLDHCMQEWDVPGLLIARPLPPPPLSSPGDAT